MITSALRSAIATLRQHERVLIATDFDGVLAPIVEDPLAARPVAGAMDRLRQLAMRAGTTVAIVSGRDLATLRQLTGVVADDLLVLVGSHGAEASVDLQLGATLDADARERLHRGTEAVADIAARHPGVRVEHKPAGVVLHTRGVDREMADPATIEALTLGQRVPGIHVMRGKEVVEIAALDVSKGLALQAISALSQTQATAYFGDDVTDEKAFAVLPSDAGNLTIKVGPGETLAEHRIDDSAEVLECLDLL